MWTQIGRQPQYFSKWKTISIFSQMEERPQFLAAMSSSRSDVVTPSVRSFVTLFFFSPKRSYGALKPYTTLSNKINRTNKTNQTNKTNKTKECTYPAQLPDPTRACSKMEDKFNFYKMVDKINIVANLRRPQYFPQRKVTSIF
jgi:hypothetical protein